MKRLSFCEVGEVVVIIGIDGNFSERLMSLGFIKGVKVEVVRYAPMKSPVEIIVKGCHYALRIDDAYNIIVE